VIDVVWEESAVGIGEVGPARSKATGTTIGMRETAGVGAWMGVAERRPEFDLIPALISSGVVFHSAIVFSSAESWFCEQPDDRHRVNALVGDGVWYAMRPPKPRRIRWFPCAGEAGGTSA
jgi:hypothetical protein